MDFKQKIADLRDQKKALIAKAEELAGGDGDNLEELNGLTDQMTAINAKIDGLANLAEASKDRAEPIDAYDGVLHSGGAGTQAPADKEKAPFASLGEQLAAIYNFRKNHVEDKRLQVVNEAQGINQGSGADGGFLIQQDFAGAVLESAVQSSPLLNRLDRHTCSSASNSMRWLTVDETDTSKSVFGGVQMYWSAEGNTVAASKPGFKEMKLDLEKMMGFIFCTDEMLTDAPFLTSFCAGAMSLAADRLLVESVIVGDGVGKPLGILNSKALITVPKENGQAAGTLLGDNIIKMQARAMPRNRERLVWLMHPDLEEQLPYLAIQSGDAAKFLWNPEGGLGGFDTQRVLNKPVLFEDNCSAVGERGDILLVDPFQYIMLVKGTVKQDWSMHVEFLTDQSCFRTVFRCNGMPKVNKTLNIKNSNTARSPYVALAARK